MLLTWGHGRPQDDTTRIIFQYVCGGISTWRSSTAIYVSGMNFSQTDAFDFTTIEHDFAEITFDRFGRHFVSSGVTWSSLPASHVITLTKRCLWVFKFSWWFFLNFLVTKRLRKKLKILSNQYLNPGELGDSRPSFCECDHMTRWQTRSCDARTHKMAAGTK